MIEEVKNLVLEYIWGAEAVAYWRSSSPNAETRSILFGPDAAAPLLAFGKALFVCFNRELTHPAEFYQAWGRVVIAVFLSDGARAQQIISENLQYLTLPVRISIPERGKVPHVCTPETYAQIESPSTYPDHLADWSARIQHELRSFYISNSAHQLPQDILLHSCVPIIIEILLTIFGRQTELAQFQDSIDRIARHRPIETINLRRREASMRMALRSIEVAMRVSPQV